MQIAAWSNFVGANRQVHPRRLAEGLGVNAENLRLGSADLRPWNAPLTVVTTGGVTPLISLYRTNRATVSDTDYWWQWTTDVDVVRTLVGTDTSEEIFYSGDGAPKSTDNVIGLPPNPGPASARTMGIPFPPTQMAAAVATTGSGTAQTRTYVDTFLNDRGRESAPGLPRTIVCNASATVNLTDLSVVPGGNHGIVTRCIYVSIDGSDYQLCVEQVATLTTATDTGSRGRVLETGGDTTKPAWLPPPTNLRGLTALWNGMLGGFFGKTFCVSEPGKPWAWPVEYQDTVHDDIVGTGVWGQNWLLLTTSTPILLRGGPLLFDRTPLAFNQACVSKRSIKGMGHGVCWASPNGLCYAGDVGAPRVVTDGILTAEQWRELNPATIVATQWERFYVGFYVVSSQRRGFMIDPLNPQGIVFLTFGANGVFYDPISDRLYLLDEGNVIKRWGAGSPLTATFKTAIVRAAAEVTPRAVMVTADEPMSVQFKLWANLQQSNGTRVWTEVESLTITSGQPVTLKGDYLAQEYQAEIKSAGPVQGVQLADAIEDLL